ncbi:hypothetical protein FN846DRAFT_992280 [Sphaerosporella brunnea]|uniref:Uncharacterized protein n=1 Tax=Sphaerosporella brunnea TaxID=1250544 RepID=A0A5J5EMC8_9PEZI|nr:hypothetical protein FN846DRAFT_992280 [Sphaerosporella brunnea]
MKRKTDSPGAPGERASESPPPPRKPIRPMARKPTSAASAARAKLRAEAERIDAARDNANVDAIIEGGKQQAAKTINERYHPEPKVGAPILTRCEDTDAAQIALIHEEKKAPATGSKKLTRAEALEKIRAEARKLDEDFAKSCVPEKHLELTAQGKRDFEALKPKSRAAVLEKMRADAKKIDDDFAKATSSDILEAYAEQGRRDFYEMQKKRAAEELAELEGSDVSDEDEDDEYVSDEDDESDSDEDEDTYGDKLNYRDDKTEQPAVVPATTATKTVSRSYYDQEDQVDYSYDTEDEEPVAPPAPKSRSTVADAKTVSPPPATAAKLPSSSDNEKAAEKEAPHASAPKTSEKEDISVPAGASPRDEADDDEHEVDFDELFGPSPTSTPVKGDAQDSTTDTSADCDMADAVSESPRNPAASSANTGTHGLPVGNRQIKPAPNDSTSASVLDQQPAMESVEIMDVDMMDDPAPAEEPAQKALAKKDAVKTEQAQKDTTKNTAAPIPTTQSNVIPGFQFNQTMPSTDIPGISAPPKGHVPVKTAAADSNQDACSKLPAKTGLPKAAGTTRAPTQATNASLTVPPRTQPSAFSGPQMKLIVPVKKAPEAPKQQAVAPTAPMDQPVPASSKIDGEGTNPAVDTFEKRNLNKQEQTQKDQEMKDAAIAPTTRPRVKWDFLMTDTDSPNIAAAAKKALAAREKKGRVSLSPPVKKQIQAASSKIDGGGMNPSVDKVAKKDMTEAEQMQQDQEMEDAATVPTARPRVKWDFLMTDGDGPNIAAAAKKVLAAREKKEPVGVSPPVNQPVPAASKIDGEGTNPAVNTAANKGKTEQKQRPQDPEKKDMPEQEQTANDLEMEDAAPIPTEDVAPIPTAQPNIFAGFQFGFTMPSNGGPSIPAPAKPHAVDIPAFGDKHALAKAPAKKHAQGQKRTVTANKSQTKKNVGTMRPSKKDSLADGKPKEMTAGTIRAPPQATNATLPVPPPAQPSMTAGNIPAPPQATNATLPVPPPTQPSIFSGLQMNLALPANKAPEVVKQEAIPTTAQVEKDPVSISPPVNEQIPAASSKIDGAGMNPVVDPPEKKDITDQELRPKDQEKKDMTEQEQTANDLEMEDAAHIPTAQPNIFAGFQFGFTMPSNGGPSISLPAKPDAVDIPALGDKNALAKGPAKKHAQGQKRTVTASKSQTKKNVGTMRPSKKDSDGKPKEMTAGTIPAPPQATNATLPVPPPAQPSISSGLQMNLALPANKAPEAVKQEAIPTTAQVEKDPVSVSPPVNEQIPAASSKIDGEGMNPAVDPLEKKDITDQEQRPNDPEKKDMTEKEKTANDLEMEDAAPIPTAQPNIFAGFQFGFTMPSNGGPSISAPAKTDAVDIPALADKNALAKAPAKKHAAQAQKRTVTANKSQTKKNVGTKRPSKKDSLADGKPKEMTAGNIPAPPQATNATLPVPPPAQPSISSGLQMNLALPANKAPEAAKHEAIPTTAQVEKDPVSISPPVDEQIPAASSNIDGGVMNQSVDTVAKKDMTEEEQMPEDQEMEDADTVPTTMTDDDSPNIEAAAKKVLAAREKNDPVSISPPVNEQIPSASSKIDGAGMNPAVDPLEKKDITDQEQRPKDPEKKDMAEQEQTANDLEMEDMTEQEQTPKDPETKVMTEQEQTANDLEMDDAAPVATAQTSVPDQTAQPPKQSPSDNRAIVPYTTGIEIPPNAGYTRYQLLMRARQIAEEESRARRAPTRGKILHPAVLQAALHRQARRAFPDSPDLPLRTTNRPNNNRPNNGRGYGLVYESDEQPSPLQAEKPQPPAQKAKAAQGAQPAEPAQPTQPAKPAEPAQPSAGPRKRVQRPTATDCAVPQAKKPKTERTLPGAFPSSPPQPRRGRFENVSSQRASWKRHLMFGALVVAAVSVVWKVGYADRSSSGGG